VVQYDLAMPNKSVVVKFKMAVGFFPRGKAAGA
jgi:hypothetical protein